MILAIAMTWANCYEHHIHIATTHTTISGQLDRNLEPEGPNGRRSPYPKRAFTLDE